MHFPFSENVILSFLFFFFLKPLLQLERVNIFKNLISASGNHFLQFFLTLIRIEAVFRYSDTDFRLIKNLVFLFRAHVCWCAPFRKLGVNQYSSICSIPNSDSSFPGYSKRIFYWMLHCGEQGTVFLSSVFLFRANLCCGNHYSN